MSERLARSKGFTLIEILMVLVVAGLMLTFALPKLLEMRTNMRLDAAVQQLAGDLRRAQVEAIKRNQAVTLKKTGTSTYTIQHIGSRTLESGATFADGSADSVRMASFGPPIGGGATFTLEVGERQKAIVVNAAGLVDVP